MAGKVSAENGKHGGRPPGRKNDATITKEQARDAMAAVIRQHAADMLESQIANAKGLKYLVVRQKSSGKFLRVPESMAKAKTGDDEEIIEVWEKDPSVQAFTDLMNRGFDKPAEQVQRIVVSGELSIVESRLLSARKRKAQSS